MCLTLCESQLESSRNLGLTFQSGFFNLRGRNGESGVHGVRVGV